MRTLFNQRRRFAFAALALIAVPSAHAGVPNGDALEAAQSLAEEGHIVQAEALLRQLAFNGEVQAMERLAMLHWCGPILYPGGPWQAAVARQWFEQAAAQGSDIGQFMVAVTQRTPGQRVVRAQPTP